MPGFSNNLENRVAEHILSIGSPLAQPAARWISLHTANPEDAAATALVNELPAVDGYARVSTGAVWAYANRQITNNAQITWPNEATGNWAAVNFFSIWDVATGGTDTNLLFSAAITNAPFTVANGQTAKLDPGDLEIHIDPGVWSDYLVERVLKFLFGINPSLVQPTIHMAMLTAAANDASTGATMPEVANAGAYARVAHATWIRSVQSEFRNSGVISFTTATADWNGGSPLQGWALVDSPTHGAGNMLIYDGFLTNKAVLNNQQAEFPSQAVVFQVG